ncbi:MAG: helix-turn-helix domain-containing protein [bacterium]|nr:helix-turn-helix domain-containing protein [bacterium]
MVSDEHSNGAAFTPQLISAVEVGELLGCSARTVRRHADAGLMPWGCKLGHLRRWNSHEIDAWIAAGCPRVRTPQAGAEK